MSYILNGAQTTVNVHLNSKDASYFNSLSNTQNSLPTSNFTYMLQNAISTNDPNNSILVKVESAEIPYSFYNVSSSLRNNKFDFQESGYSVQEIIIPEQNHTINTLISSISNSLNSASSANATYSLSYNQYTNKITFLSSISTDFTFDFSNNPNTGSILGFLPYEYTSEDTSLVSESVVNLNTVPFILIDSSFGAQGAQVSHINGNASILAKVPTNSPFNNEIFYKDSNNSGTNSLILRRDRIDKIELTLRDPYFNVIDLNSKNWSITLSFSFIDINNQSGIVNQQGQILNQINQTTRESLGEKNIELRKEQARVARESELKRENMLELINSGVKF